MAEIYTMSGTKLVMAADLLRDLSGDPEIKHAVVLVTYFDDTVEVYNSRASMSEVSYMLSVASAYHHDLVRGSWKNE
jgi:frataxin-like iron-binding protein CyaY